MYARVTTLSMQKGKGVEAIEIYKASVLPAAQTQKGYCGSYVLADLKTDKGITVTFWRSEEDALDSEENHYFQEQLVKVMNLFATPPSSESYEVAVEDLSLPAKKKRGFFKSRTSPSG